MIELKDVSFTYESGETQNNLNHINLIVGDNNCGKTSFLEALPPLCADS